MPVRTWLTGYASPVGRRNTTRGSSPRVAGGKCSITFLDFRSVAEFPMVNDSLW